MIPDDRLDNQIVLQDVSKFYGEVLGVNRVSLQIPPGLTSLVGPNGAGKTTMLNVIAGLLRPTRGRVTALGVAPEDRVAYYRQLRYVTQVDAFPGGLTGLDFIRRYLLVAGWDDAAATARSWAVLERLNLLEAARRKVAGYSKGMRQRLRLGQAIAQDPRVLLLDEPLNGLDPLARTECIAFFKELAAEGRHVLLSSHILHEVDLMSDRVVLLSAGYVVAEGDIHGVRTELGGHPLQILIRCDQPGLLAARVIEQDHVAEVRIHDDRQGLFVKTRDAQSFYRLLNRIVLDCDLTVETVRPADDDADALYQYLIEDEEAEE